MRAGAMVSAIILMTTIAEPAVTRQRYGTMPDGTTVDVYTLREGAIEVRIISYGATVIALSTPDRNQQSADIVLGFDDLAGYRSQANPYFGSIIGRYANRIARGEFTLG